MVYASTYVTDRAFYVPHMVISRTNMFTHTEKESLRPRARYPLCGIDRHMACIDEVGQLMDDAANVVTLLVAGELLWIRATVSIYDSCRLGSSIECEQ